MPGAKKSRASVVGRQLATDAAAAVGREVRASRLRRHLTQKALADRVSLSRSQIAKVESGRGAPISLNDWFAIGEALGRRFKAEFLRDRLEAPVDAGHLDIQQLLIRKGAAAGYEKRVELPWRSGDPRRWTDVALVSTTRRRLILCECVNSFGDIGASFRSSDRKVADAHQLAAALAHGGPDLEVGLCWVVREIGRNREILRRYEDLFAARFTGSSRAWVEAFTKGAAPPDEPGLVWCDARATRLFAWRRR